MRNKIISRDVSETLAAPLPWQQFSGATILITGAAGFLPAYMVETLLELNESLLPTPAKIIALVRNETRARERFAAYAGRSDLEFMVQDVCQPISMLGPVDYVIHAASQASPRFYRDDPVGTLSANVLGTHNLLSAFRHHPIKGFLFFSSAEIYGSLDPTDLRSCYAESKRMGETMCVAWGRQFGIPTRIVRPFHTYGPGMRLEDGRVFADFVRDILNSGPIVLQSDGSARRCFCYLGDANVAFFTVLLLGKNGEAYNVANPDGECSISELANRLARLYPGVNVVPKVTSTVVPCAAQDSPTILPDITKMLTLGWSPRVQIEEGFRRTVESYSHPAS